MGYGALRAWATAHRDLGPEKARAKAMGEKESALKLWVNESALRPWVRESARTMTKGKRERAG